MRLIAWMTAALLCWQSALGAARAKPFEKEDYLAGDDSANEAELSDKDRQMLKGINAAEKRKRKKKRGPYSDVWKDPNWYMGHSPVGHGFQPPHPPLLFPAELIKAGPPVGALIVAGAVAGGIASLAVADQAEQKRAQRRLEKAHEKAVNEAAKSISLPARAQPSQEDLAKEYKALQDAKKRGKQSTDSQ